jgi:RND family efflux transporter MFP subunit
VVALAGTSACDTASPATRAPHAQAQAHRQPTVADTSAMRVDTMTVTASRSYPSQVYVEHDVAVAAQASGVLDSVFVQLGSPVRGGALLALVDAGGQDIELARARERVERARAAVQRAQTLAKSGSTTTVESEQLAGELQQAELSVRAAERALALTRVRAPVGGVVTARYARPRQLVAVGDTLFRVAETGPQLVRVRIAGPDGRHVRAGERAFVRETTGGASASGTVAFVAPALEPASGTREVIVRLGASRFLVGESVIVEMGSERRVAVVAPRAAIAADGYALVAQGDRTVMRSVTVGATLAGERVEILSGLAFGERLAPLRR